MKISLSADMLKCYSYSSAITKHGEWYACRVTFQPVSGPMRISKTLLSEPGTCRGRVRRSLMGRALKFTLWLRLPSWTSAVACTVGPSETALSSWGDASPLLPWDSACQDAFVTLATLIYAYRTGMKKTWLKLIHNSLVLWLLSILCRAAYSNFYEETSWYEHIRKK